MVHKTIHPTDNTDIWDTLHVSIPTNYQHPAVHLQAQIMMQQISVQDAEHINTDTAAITAYPRADDSPALLIWQLPCPNTKIPKAAGITVNGRHTESSLTTTHTDTYTAK